MSGTGAGNQNLLPAAWLLGGGNTTGCLVTFSSVFTMSGKFQQTRTNRNVTADIHRWLSSLTVTTYEYLSTTPSTTPSTTLIL